MSINPCTRASGARQVFRRLLSLTLIAGCSASASAALISPGESLTAPAIDSSGPLGVLIAEGQTPFTLHYIGAAPLDGFSESIDAWFSDSVLRNQIDHTLTFTYSIALNSGTNVSGLAGGSRLDVTDFSGWTTDLAGAIDLNRPALLSRTIDGKTVSLANPSNATGGAPLLVVKTNATEFDTLGAMQFNASDRFAAQSGSEPASADAAISGVFRPAAAAVPLPDATYTALGVMLACALITVARRSSSGS